MNAAAIKDLVPLSTVNPSTCVHINEINAQNKLHLKLLSLGIGVGSALEVLRNRKGDMVLSLGNNRISLGRNIAQHLMVSAQ